MSKFLGPPQGQVLDREIGVAYIPCRGSETAHRWSQVNDSDGQTQAEPLFP